MTPKVHKPGSTQSMHKDIPGRPIVNFIDCHTSKISKFVDHYLQPYAKALPSYFQDTTDFKNKLEAVKDKSKGPIFVQSHYSHIVSATTLPTFQTTRAQKETIIQLNVNTHTSNHQSFISHINIELSYVQIQTCLQIKDCEMGAICAPAYANILMRKIEKLHIPYLLE